jgi:hypothetical protein
MNSAHAVVPPTNVPDIADAVCAVRRGDLNVAGAHGSGVLIAPGVILTAAHVIQNYPWPVGTFELPAEGTSARSVCLRRLTNGSAPLGGVDENYHQVRVVRVTTPISGVRDIALLELAEDVTHISPIPVDTGSPAVQDPLALYGWGLLGDVFGQGARPHDARRVDGRRVSLRHLNASGRVHLFAAAGPHPGVNQFDSGGPQLRLVDGVWKIAGVTLNPSAYAEAVEQYRHDAQFRIPGLYTPEPVYSSPTAVVALSARRI